MKSGLKVTFKNIEHTEHMVDFIETKFSRLKKYGPKLVKCEVKISLPHKSKRSGNVAQVVLSAAVPGKELIVKRKTDPNAERDLYGAISDSFRTLENQVKDHRIKRFSLADIGTVTRRARPQYSAI